MCVNSGLTASGLMPSTIVEDRIRGLRTYIVQKHYQKGTERNENFCIVCFNRKWKESDPNFHQESAGLFWRRLAQVLLVFQARAVHLDLVVEEGRPAMRFGD